MDIRNLTDDELDARYRKLHARMFDLNDQEIDEIEALEDELCRRDDEAQSNAEPITHPA